MRKLLLASTAIAVLAIAGCDTGETATLGEDEPTTEPDSSPTPQDSDLSPSPTEDRPTQTPSTIGTPEPADRPPSRADLPELEPVSIDGWRFGVAWTGFDRHTSEDPYITAPGEALYTFHVLIANIDDRRDEAPSAWLAPSDFLFYLDEGDCKPDICESKHGDVLPLTDCDTVHSDITGDTGKDLGVIPLYGLVEYTCTISTAYPDDLRPEQFTILYQHDYAELTPPLELQR